MHRYEGYPVDAYKQRSLRLLIVVQLAQQFRVGIVSPILALFIRGRGFSLSQIGLIGTASLLGWLIFEPIAGVIADRIQKKYLVIFAFIFSTFIYLAYPYAQNFWHFALLAFGLSSVMSAYAIAVKALTAELLPKTARGRAYGRFVSIISMGGIISPILGGYLSEIFGHTMPFFFAAFFGIIGLGAALLINYNKEKSKSEIELDLQFSTSLLNSDLMGIFLIRSLFIFNLVFRQHTLPIFLNENPRYSASESQIGLYFGLVQLSSAISKTFLGDLNDKVGSKRLIIVSLFLSGLSYWMIVGLSGLSILLMIGVLQGVFFATADLSMMVYLMDIMPSGRTGMAMGLYSEAENVGGIIAAPSLGYVYDTFSPSYATIVVASVLILDSILSIYFIKANRKIDFDATSSSDQERLEEEKSV